VSYQAFGNPFSPPRICALEAYSPRPSKFKLTPWIVEEHNDVRFIVKDATRQALGYFYFEHEPGRQSAAKLLTREERQRQMAANFAKLLAVRRGAGAPKSATPPNFNSPKQIAMVVRQFASAIGR
jgi:hypothetical protein